MHVATRLATTFGGSTLSTVALVVAAVSSVSSSSAPGRAAVPATPAPQHVPRVPACERHWFAASLPAELWQWPGAFGPVLASTAIDRAAWIGVLCDQYGVGPWLP